MSTHQGAKTKVRTAAEAVGLIGDATTVLVDGSGGGVNEPDLLLDALAERFRGRGSPRDLRLVHPSGMGDGHGGGIDRLAHDGLIATVIGGHWGWSRQMQRLADEERIAAWCLPQGVMSHLLRDIAAGRPGAITSVGLGTFADPRLDGGRLNARAATEPDLVRVVELDGREWLHYRAFPIDVAIIRGTVADAAGNITMDEEGLYAETLSAAQATKNSGGIVLAQVKYLVATGTLDPRRVRVPGVLVDAVVVNPAQRLSFESDRDPALTGQHRVAPAGFAPMPLSVRKVIARRAAVELAAGDIVNLGFGMPDGVASVLAEEGLEDEVTFTVEQGHIGGVPALGANFGMARNQHAMVSADHQFDWYDGGGLDLAVLSFAQVDRHGNVNVGKFAGRIPGVGGFVNISQGARRVVFVGTLTAGRPAFRFQAGLRIDDDHGTPKFVEAVEQVSFSATQALAVDQRVLYVTERAVFDLTADGPLLTEVAPGLDIERDVLARLAFRPKLSAQLATMDAALFGEPPLRLQLQAREVPR